MSAISVIGISYLIGAVISFIITFFLTKDPSFAMRLLSALLIALTWPLSFPMALIFSIFS
ncbi:GhoT/OrtT family toxin [Proteus vulgaris]|uniref:GhoT/OrtT family toxin n=1 Tax=Proteus TaxID=583 RepID=UPI000D68DBDD|nr:MULTISPECIES: GhoT/OrtT family toxin [Proteus]MBQ0212844.1 GhoT/OrtT family toxin [Proteus vulgaris]MDS0789225.1 GhoT/OrtT family toxin [Proteus vulgaris]NBM55868.1 GhoT/OrtT family toxin [Proteus sp. G2669]UDN34680.1 GhoT/OrtT family toxin [Proteus sp. NMG38-2]UPK79787.1 GhoT/OrtT family toxin [Proteus vulgaris]